MKLFLARYLSAVLKCFFKLRYRSHVVFGNHVILNHKFRFKGTGKLIIDDHVNMYAHEEKNAFYTYTPEAVIFIGKNTRLNGVAIHCRKSVSIGQDCLIGSAILIDNDFHSVHFETRNDPSEVQSRPITIKDRVWLAGQCAILKGVTIGEESVVGFRAVVTKDVPSKKIVAGNPAQIVKDLAGPSPRGTP